jgi:PhzF family phenazine biosynthesis protein
LRIHHVDAFTQTPFTGNPANVILDADGRDAATLAAIAREFAGAETAFVLAAEGPDHDLRIRFFNARGEWPFVGHATLAAHAVLLAAGRRGGGRCLQKSGTGIIEVAAHDGLLEFRQGVPVLEPPLPLKTTLRVAEALRLPARALHAALPARLARKGSTRLVVPVAEPAALDGLAPNFETLEALGRELGAEGFFAIAYGRSGDAVTTEARMFCPALGLPEDPVSGNAHAMLAAYLWEHHVLDRHTHTFRGRQGRHVQRPGTVEVALELDHQGLLAAVRIGGTAVIVSSGELNL